MCCLFAVLLVLGPRVAGVLWWLLQPGRWNAAFGSIIWPILGLVLLPWTTLMYVLVAPGGIDGFDWLWLALSVAADVAGYASGAKNRDKIPGGYGKPAV